MFVQHLVFLTSFLSHRFLQFTWCKLPLWKNFAPWKGATSLPVVLCFLLQHFLGFFFQTLFSEGDQAWVFTPLELGAPWWVAWLGFLALLMPDLPKVIPRASSLLCVNCLVALNPSSPSPWFVMGNVRNDRLFLVNVSCDSKPTTYRKIVKNLFCPLVFFQVSNIIFLVWLFFCVLSRLFSTVSPKTASAPIAGFQPNKISLDP